MEHRTQWAALLGQWRLQGRRGHIRKLPNHGQWLRQLQCVGRMAGTVGPENGAGRGTEREGGTTGKWGDTVLHRVLTRASCILKATRSQAFLKPGNRINQAHTLERQHKQFSRRWTAEWKKSGNGDSEDSSWESRACKNGTSAGRGKSRLAEVLKVKWQTFEPNRTEAEGNRESQIAQGFRLGGTGQLREQK